MKEVYQERGRKVLKIPFEKLICIDAMRCATMTEILMRVQEGIVPYVYEE